MCIRHANAHVQGGISPSFPLQPKTADAHKNGHFAHKHKRFCCKNKVFYNFFSELELVINWVRVELWWAMIFKIFPHLITHLITGSSKIISSENLAEKTAVFGRKIYFLVPQFLYTQLYLTPLEHYPFLASYILKFVVKSRHLLLFSKLHRILIGAIWFLFW